MENCKKRKLGDEDSEQSSSNYDDDSTEKFTISENSGELTSEKPGSDHVPAMCCSSEESSELLVDDSSKSVDLKAKIFKTDEKTTSTNNKFSETSPVSVICGGDDSLSDEMESLAKKSPVLPMMPSIDELEEFLSTAEKLEQKRFMEKYNFDVLNDVPLEGRYEWTPLTP